TRPTAVILNGILGHITDLDHAQATVRTLMAAVPSGSFLVVNDGVRGEDPARDEAQDAYNDSGAAPYLLRTPEEITGYFDDLELVEPGVVPTSTWRSEGRPDDTGAQRVLGVWSGVARKP
ncbi:MAG: SAM-dependent methyltransferase, partial [Nocardioides sp.]